MTLRRLLIPVALCALSACLCKSREERLQDAEDQGNILAATKARVAKGVGEALKKEGKEAAVTVTEGVGEVVKGVGSGVEKSLFDVKVDVTEALAAQGVTVTRAARGEASARDHSVTAYVATEKPYQGTLELRVYDELDREAGRVRVHLDEAEPVGKYVDFTFDPRAPLLTAKRFELREVCRGPCEVPDASKSMR
jgi:hypothetical protein